MLKGSSGHFVIGFLVFLKSGSKILLPESVGINSGYSVNQILESHSLRKPAWGLLRLCREE